MRGDNHVLCQLCVVYVSCDAQSLQLQSLLQFAFIMNSLLLCFSVWWFIILPLVPLSVVFNCEINLKSFQITSLLNYNLYINVWHIIILCYLNVCSFSLHQLKIYLFWNLYWSFVIINLWEIKKTDKHSRLHWYVQRIKKNGVKKQLLST